MTIAQTLGSGVHSYLDITLSNGTSYVLEGASDMPLSGGYLNPFKSDTGDVKGDDPTKNAVDFDARENTKLSPEEICADIDKIMASFAAFPTNAVPYSLLGRRAPNSNSFVHYLLNSAPDLGKINHSKRAYGWNYPITLP